MEIDKTSIHFKGTFANIYDVNKKFPNGGTDGDYVEIDGWAHYWNADRGTWTVNAERDSYWDEKISSFTSLVKNLQDTIASKSSSLEEADAALQKGIEALAQAGYRFMGVATPETEPEMQTENVFYLSSVKGDYKNFRTVSTVNEETTYGTVKVGSGEIALLLYKGYGTSAATDDGANTIKTGWKKITLNLDNIQRAVTQEDYDKLVSEGKVDENTYYNILEE